MKRELVIVIDFADSTTKEAARRAENAMCTAKSILIRQILRR